MVIAPYAGAWIETLSVGELNYRFQIAPYAGAWIETTSYANLDGVSEIAPYAGAWIETSYSSYGYMFGSDRTLRGCVD